MPYTPPNFLRSSSFRKEKGTKYRLLDIAVNRILHNHQNTRCCQQVSAISNLHSTHPCWHSHHPSTNEVCTYKPHPRLSKTYRFGSYTDCCCLSVCSLPQCPAHSTIWLVARHDCQSTRRVRCAWSCSEADSHSAGPVHMSACHCGRDEQVNRLCYAASN